MMSSKYLRQPTRGAVGNVGEGSRDGILAVAEFGLMIALGIVCSKRLLKMRWCLNEVTLLEARQAENSKTDYFLSPASFVLRFAHKGLGGFPREGRSPFPRPTRAAGSGEVSSCASTSEKRWSGDRT